MYRKILGLKVVVVLALLLAVPPAAQAGSYAMIICPFQSGVFLALPSGDQVAVVIEEDGAPLNAPALLVVANPSIDPPTGRFVRFQSHPDDDAPGRVHVHWESVK